MNVTAPSQSAITPRPADLGFIPLPVEAPAFSSILRRGLEKNRNEALAQARLTYGSDAVVGTDFDVKKTAGGEWYWGPIEAAKKPTPGKPAKASGKAAKAPRATKAENRPRLEIAVWQAR